MKSRILLTIGDYTIRATFRIVGAFVIVAIDWMHPNYGYFADGMLWYRSMHMSDWNMIPIAGWSFKYLKRGKRTSLEKFLKDYPEFKELFKIKLFNEIL
jgi:hypothetical protein